MAEMQEQRLCLPVKNWWWSAVPFVLSSRWHCISKASSESKCTTVLISYSCLASVWYIRDSDRSICLTGVDNTVSLCAEFITFATVTMHDDFRVQWENKKQSLSTKNSMSHKTIMPFDMPFAMISLWWDADPWSCMLQYQNAKTKSLSLFSVQLLLHTLIAQVYRLCAPRYSFHPLISTFASIDETHSRQVALGIEGWLGNLSPWYFHAFARWASWHASMSSPPAMCLWRDASGM